MLNEGWLAELWRYRELLYFLAWRDVKVRYKQAAFGAAWAIAQPLFTMIPRAEPPDLARCSRETVTGAACARFVVNTAAAVAGRSDTSSARSGPRPCALMPTYAPAARNPLGVATPPANVSRV